MDRYFIPEFEGLTASSEQNVPIFRLPIVLLSTMKHLFTFQD